MVEAISIQLFPHSKSNSAPKLQTPALQLTLWPPNSKKPCPNQTQFNIQLPSELSNLELNSDSKAAKLAPSRKFDPNSQDLAPPGDTAASPAGLTLNLMLEQAALGGCSEPRPPLSVFFRVGTQLQAAEFKFNLG